MCVVAKTSPGNVDFLPFLLKWKNIGWDFAVQPHSSPPTSSVQINVSGNWLVQNRVLLKSNRLIIIFHI
jgi:hypothetical protein